MNEDKFFDREETGEHLYETIIELGETVTFLADEFNEEKKLVMSLNTKMGTSMERVNKEHIFIGVMTFENREQIDTFKGRYFTREINPTKKYILTATTENPFTEKYAECEVVECNEIVNIGYEEIKFNPLTEDDERIFTPIYENVSVFASINARLLQETQAGGINQSVIDMIIPAKYPITTYNVVARKEFVAKDQFGKEKEYTDVPYKIESVNNSMINTKDNVQFYGVFDVQLTKTL